MKNAFFNALRIACMILGFAVVGYTQTTASSNRVRVKDTLTLSGNSLAEVVMVISAASKNNESPTAKAVYDYIQAYALAGDVTGTPGATVVEAIQGNPVGDYGTPATQHTVLRWSGTEWVPNGINLFEMKSASGSISARVNQVWASAASAAITLNLPACNANHSGLKIEIAKTGTGTYAVIVEPAGSETFSDGATSKSIYSAAIGLSCTCRWTGSAGVWHFINL